MAQKNDPRESDSPILFAGISESYLRAFDVLWKAEFESKNPFHWDKVLIFHPISHLLGVCIETAIKGLLVCKGAKLPKTHNLETLLSQLDDAELEKTIWDDLNEVTVPAEIVELNKDRDLDELTAMYRRHHYHIHMLNSIYGRPYATRYPVLGGHCLPDPKAMRIISHRLPTELNKRKREWRPKGSKPTTKK